MLYNERVEIILQQIQLQSTVKTPELSELLHVSLDTVRRDLKAMERDGLVKCVHGGACLPETYGAFSNFKGREVIHSDLKREASRKALAYIKPGDIIALNSGTTNTILAQEMSLRCKDITVVTNNLAATNILLLSPGIRVIAIGGEVDPTEQSTFGITCERNSADIIRTSPFFPSTRSTIKTGLPTFACRKWTLSAFWRSMPAASSR